MVKATDGRYSFQLLQWSDLTVLSSKLVVGWTLGEEQTDFSSVLAESVFLCPVLACRLQVLFC